MKILFSSKFIITLIFTFLIILTATVFYTSSSNPEWSHFRITNPNGVEKEISFPFSDTKSPDGLYLIQGAVFFNKKPVQYYQIIPDDEVISISINGVKVDLSSVHPSARKDYVRGFSYPLGKYFKSGENQISIEIRQYGYGIMGLKILEKPSIIPWIALAIVFIGFVFGILFYLNGRHKLLIFMLFACFLRLFYWHLTGPNDRGHDMTEHRDYVVYLAEHILPPSLDQAVDGAFFHPPLYYYTAALFWSVSQWLSSDTYISERILQLLSLFYSMIFVYFGLKCLFLAGNYLSQISSRNRIFIETLVAFVFISWPSAIIHGIRIGNDPLLYAAFSGAMYYLFLWYHDLENKKYRLAVVVFTVIAILAKANGILIAVSWLFILVLQILKSGHVVRTLNSYKYSLIAVGIAAILTFGPGVLLKLQGQRQTVYVDNIENVSSALRVGNSPAHFLWFDLKTFITEPFTSPWDDEKGRQYFPNYLGKTGLFGEFQFRQPFMRFIAEILSVLSLIMLMYVFVFFYRSSRKWYLDFIPWILPLIFQLAGISYMRATFP
jgi:hypothetical protein